MSLTTCSMLKKHDKMSPRRYNNPGWEPWQGTGTEGWILVLYFPATTKETTGRTEALLKDETWSGRVWRTLSLHVFHSPTTSFFDMQKVLSHARSKIVSQVVKEGWCDDGNPISIWTITLPSGLAVHLFQFDWLGKPCSPKAASPAIVFREPGTEGVGLMGLVHFSGIQLLWPKFANTFKVGPWPKSVCITRCSLIRPYMPQFSHLWVSACVYVCVYMHLSSCVCLSVMMYDHESAGASITCVHTCTRSF